MCNLYSVTKGKQAIAQLFEADLPFELPEVKSHIHPGFISFIVRQKNEARTELSLIIVSQRWGAVQHSIDIEMSIVSLQFQPFSWNNHHSAAA